MTRNARVRFMANNFADSHATITSSSAASLYPLTNAYNSIRSKLFKFAGNFTVTASNCTLYINDGSNKTVTLTTGDYTGSTLATHIQTQLNASSSSWTCTHSGLKFTIGRTGSATLRLSQTSSSAWDLLGYVGTSDRTGTSTSWTSDENRIHSEEWVMVDTGLPMQLDFGAIIGKLGETFHVSDSATVKIQANNVNLWTAPPLDVTVDPHDRGLMAFLDTIDDRVYRYHRWYIKDRTNPLGSSDFCPIGYLYLGGYETITLSNIQPGFGEVRLDPSARFDSDAGVQYWRTKPSYREWSGLTIGKMLQAERIRLQQLYETVGQRTPFFASLDPTLVLSSALPDMTAYVRFAGDNSLKHVFTSYMDLSFGLREVV